MDLDDLLSKLHIQTTDVDISRETLHVVVSLYDILLKCNTSERFRQCIQDCMPRQDDLEQAILSWVRRLAEFDRVSTQKTIFDCMLGHKIELGLRLLSLPYVILVSLKRSSIRSDGPFASEIQNRIKTLDFDDLPNVILACMHVISECQTQHEWQQVVHATYQLSENQDFVQELFRYLLKWAHAVGYPAELLAAAYKMPMAV